MKKFGLLVMALAVVAVLGVTVYAAVFTPSKASTNSTTSTTSKTFTPSTVSTANGVVAKFMTTQGTITAIDEKAHTFTLEEKKATSKTTTTFKVSAGLARTLTVGENIVINYTKLPSGENEAFYVQRVKEGAPKK